MPEQILAEGFHCSLNSLRTLSDNVKWGWRHGVRHDPDALGPEGGAELRAGWRDSCQ